MTDLDSLEDLRRRQCLPAKLVFDTASRPVTPGTRRRTSNSRHLLYQVEDLCLDLRLDRPQPTGESVMVGQLADRKDPLKPLAGLPIFLVSGETVLARTFSNRQGEFRVQYEAQVSLSLCLSQDNDRRIEIPVDPMVGEDAISGPG